MMRAEKRGEQESEGTETREGVRRERAGAGESKDQQKGKERARRQRGGGLESSSTLDRGLFSKKPSQFL